MIEKARMKRHATKKEENQERLSINHTKPSEMKEIEVKNGTKMSVKDKPESEREKERGRKANQKHTRKMSKREKRESGGKNGT